MQKKTNTQYIQNLLDDCFWYIYIIKRVELQHPTEEEQKIWNYSSSQSIRNLVNDYIWGIMGNIWSILDSICNDLNIEGHKKFINNNRNEHFHLFAPRKEKYTIDQVYDVYKDTCDLLKLRSFKSLGDWVVDNKTNGNIVEPNWVQYVFSQLQSSILTLKMILKKQ